MNNHRVSSHMLACAGIVMSITSMILTMCARRAWTILLLVCLLGMLAAAYGFRAGEKQACGGKREKDSGMRG